MEAQIKHLEQQKSGTLHGEEENEVDMEGPSTNAPDEEGEKEANISYPRSATATKNTSIFLRGESSSSSEDEDSDSSSSGSELENASSKNEGKQKAKRKQADHKGLDEVNKTKKAKSAPGTSTAEKVSNDETGIVNDDELSAGGDLDHGNDDDGTGTNAVTGAEKSSSGEIRPADDNDADHGSDEDSDGESATGDEEAAAGEEAPGGEQASVGETEGGIPPTAVAADDSKNKRHASKSPPRDNKSPPRRSQRLKTIGTQGGN